MKTTAKVDNSFDRNMVTVQTNDSIQELTIPGKSTGMGPAVSGGEFLWLALATCFCNDIYRVAEIQNTLRAGVKVSLLP